MKRKMYPIWLKMSALLVAVLAHGALMAQTCLTPLDIHVANDISGSVDGRELQQSKNFISQLGLAVPLGNGVQQSRVGISQWSSSSTIQEYAFPSAGATYTTLKSDIISYASSARPFEGSTNPYAALLKAYEWVLQDPVSGRTGKPVIVLMTDASCDQIPNNLSNLATEIKSAGITIVVLAIDFGSFCTALQGTNVASPGAYFSAQDYETLQNNALSYISSILNVACTPPTSNIDLTVAITNFEIISCNTTPSATATYTVTNSGSAVFNGSLDVSFYNGNPTTAGAQYLFTASSVQSLVAYVGSYTGSTSNAALLNAGELYAVVNLNGSTLPANALPLRVNLSGTTLTDATESNLSNNFSSAYTRTNGIGCNPFAQLDVQVSNSGQVCDNEIVYYITVCNTGTIAAKLNLNNYLTAYPPAAYTLVSSQLVGNSPFVGESLPAGACATYAYTYDLTNAVASTTYNFSVDVKDIKCGMYITATIFKEFLCHNLGAITTADPFTPSWELNGAYVQWGRRGPNTTGNSAVDWQTAGNTANFAAAPTGPLAADANDGAVSGWSGSAAGNSAWNDGGKSATDPCPTGYRVPTHIQLRDAVSNNTWTQVGTWIAGVASYSSGFNVTQNNIGPTLYFPANGIRSSTNGSLVNRGSFMTYWTSTFTASSRANALMRSAIDPTQPNSTNQVKLAGGGVRCIAE